MPTTIEAPILNESYKEVLLRDHPELASHPPLVQAVCTIANGVSPLNSAPVGWREVDEFEFAQAQCEYGLNTLYKEYRQMHYLADGTKIRQFGKEAYIHACLFFNHDGTGYAMQFFHYWFVGNTEHYDYKRKHGYGLPRPKNARAVKFFRFGCDHEIKEESVGRCLHRRTCVKCGYERVVDSSD